MLPTKQRARCGGKPSSTRQPHQNPRAALTLHSRHHIRDPQFSPNQQATLEIEKALLKPPAQFFLTGSCFCSTPKAHQELRCPFDPFGTITASSERLAQHSTNGRACPTRAGTATQRQDAHVSQSQICFLHLMDD